MEQYLKVLLAGIRQWVNGKLEDISFVISNHINELTDRVETIEGDINEQEDLIELIDGKIGPLETRIESVEGELDNLGDFTCGTIEPTTTNFVEGTTYTIHESLQRTANLFEGYQGEIDDINDLIPNQATTQNQLADKAFVNSTVATNAANFRGNWSNWTNVPTDASLYPEDYVGNRTPTNNDYMVIQDTNDYVSPEAMAHKLTVVNLHATKNYTIGVTDEYGVYNEYYYANGFNNTWKIISNEYSIKYIGGTPGTWYIKTNKPEDTQIIKDGVSYSNANDGIELVKTNASTVPVIIGIQSQAGKYQGSWRFIYVGDWTTNGRLGWKPQYQIGSSFTAEQQAAIDSTITANKVATYDGYGTKITALQTDKLDKNYTANKIYGTDSLGAQTVYTLGNGLAFDNGQIKCTRTTAAWGNITGTLSNQTDLQNALDSKQDTLTAGDNIDITDNTISAKGYVFDETKGSLAIKYKQDDGDGGQIVSNSATGLGAVAEGYRTQATGDYGSHAEGTETVASGAASHAEGNKATATNNGAHAEGYRTQATGRYSHVEGTETVASGRDAHAEGTNTTASERAAHAEGLYTDATGYSSHAEGWGLETLHNLASGGGSHVEGIGTKAINKGAHAEGYGSEQAPNTASGYGSHVEGCLTLAQNQSEHAEGSANVSHKASDDAGNAGNTQHSIGIAFGNNTGTYRKNAVEVMQNGDYYLLGVGGYQGTDTKVQNASIMTVQEVINSKADAYETATNDDIDFMFTKEIKLIREQINDKNYIDWLVNTNGETMEYNGQTYYKWVSWANDGNNNGSWTLVEYPNIIVLTNTLDVQLPFNTNSPEFEYWITIDGEGGMGVNNYIKGDYTQKTFQ